MTSPTLSSKGVHVAHINARSLLSNLDKLKLFMHHIYAISTASQFLRHGFMTIYIRAFINCLVILF